RVYLLDYLIQHLPETLQKKAQKHIVPAYLVCRVWEPDDFSTGDKSSFETLVKWVPIEDLPILWERASKDVAKEDGGLSWRAEKVQLAIVRYWITLPNATQQYPDFDKKVHSYLRATDAAELSYDH